MGNEIVLLRFPTLLPMLLLSAGIFYYTKLIIKSSRNRYWNLFLIGIGLIVLSKVFEFAAFLYEDTILLSVGQGLFALSGVVLGLAAIYRIKGGTWYTRKLQQ